MKLISFQHAQGQSYGVYTDAGIIDLGTQFGEKYPDLKSALSPQAQAEIAAYAATASCQFQLDQVTLLPVIPNPDKILCVGHNYEAHRVETNRAKTDHPSIFMRYAGSQVGHLQPILKPYESDQLDYEGEIAIVIGQEGRRISQADAWNYVAGYSCYNDGSVRDWQWHTQQFGPGKNFSHTGAFGPYLVSADEIAPNTVMTLTTRLNGEVMQQTDTSMMLFNIPRLIEYCSTFLTLYPGDVIVTGTPSGVGAKRTPPIFMKAGDIVEVEVDKIGILRNSIAVG